MLALLMSDFLFAEVKSDSISFLEFVPDSEQTTGPVSWHLSKTDIADLKKSRVRRREASRAIKKSWCRLANFLGATVGKECDESNPGK